MAVCLLSIIFPNVANDYKLTLLLPGVLALLLDGRDKSRRAVLALSISCLLMVPKSYLFFRGVGFSNLINPLLLLALAAVTIFDRRLWRTGWRLLPYRVLQVLSDKSGHSSLHPLIANGRSITFLQKPHWSLRFDATRREGTGQAPKPAS
jgi:hypothetical protein